MNLNTALSNIRPTPEMVARGAAHQFLGATITELANSRDRHPHLDPYKGLKLLEHAGRGRELIAAQPEFRAAMWLRTG